MLSFWSEKEYNGDERMMIGMKLSPHVEQLTEEIVRLCAPEKIYLFHIKVNLENEVTSFKLCIVAHTEEKKELERRIYLQLDCALPFDFVLYTPEEWEVFLNTPHSFAGEVQGKGVLIYDKAQTSGESN